MENGDFDLDFFMDIDVNEVLSSLRKNRDTLDTFSWIGKAFECYKINRFVGIESEKALESKANSLNQNSSFLAGLVFLNGNNSKHIQYKIRMGKDLVPSSNELKSQ